MILDEAQRSPDLFSYIQILVDEHKDWKGQFILTGSQDFLLLDRVSQSLAGRSAILHLLPFSLSELTQWAPFPVDDIGPEVQVPLPPSFSLEDALFTGLYPRIHDQKIPVQEWMEVYYQAYLERDVRNVLQVGDLEAFGRFVRLCAGRTGQLLNLSSLANDCGISQPTARKWLSVLEASFVVRLLRPHFTNFGKRLVKSPKLYFLDTGLLCYLLRIRSPEHILHRAERGAIFETFVISELVKNYLNRGRQPDLYFWRDSAGHEIDVVLDRGSELVPIEIKSGKTISSDFFKNLNYWHSLKGNEQEKSVLIYGGDQSYRRSGVDVFPWFAM